MDFLTPEQREKLKAAAEAASVGPWWTEQSYADNGEADGLDIFSPVSIIVNEGNVPHDDDAEFIAAANPAVILALLAELEAAQANAMCQPEDELKFAIINLKREFSDEEVRAAVIEELDGICPPPAAAPAGQLSATVQGSGDAPVFTITTRPGDKIMCGGKVIAEHVAVEDEQTRFAAEAADTPTKP